MQQAYTDKYQVFEKLDTKSDMILKTISCCFLINLDKNFAYLVSSFIN